MDAKQTHATDQAVAAMRSLAACIASFYCELVNSGVPQPDALTLTLEQLRASLRPPDGA
jgi:hypothetical protein